MNEQMVMVGTEHIVPGEQKSSKGYRRSRDIIEANYEPLPTTAKARFDVFYVFIVAALILAIIASLIIWRVNVHIDRYEESIRVQAVETYKAELQAQVEAESAARMEALNSEAAVRKREIDLFAKLFEGVRDYHFSENSLITYGLSAYNRVDNSDPLYADTLHEVLTQQGQYETYSDNNPIVKDYKRIAEKLVDIRYNGESRPVTNDYVWAKFIDGEVWLTKKFNSSNITDYWQYTG